ncbi:hypothetical protein F5Y01DRAFT_313615 [Xylaria sp. FL0043]|nr:hypothetical protein F5Y01DRAFT_313615 [Xylaria sp. FL0043]
MLAAYVTTPLPFIWTPPRASGTANLRVVRTPLLTFSGDTCHAAKVGFTGDSLDMWRGESLMAATMGGQVKYYYSCALQYS